PRRGAEALPELALGGGALAERHVGDLVAVRDATGELAATDIARGLRAADGGEALASRATRLGDDVEMDRTTVARHLPPTRGGVVRGADRLQQHLGGSDAERERERAVAVVGEEPVV